MKKIIFLILLFVIGCKQSTEPLGNVTATVEDSQLVITNNTPTVKYYQVFE